MGKYRSLGTKFDNVYRNDLNANFDDVDKDIKAETTRAKQREDNIQAQVNTLVVNGDSSPAAAQAAVDAKGVDKGNLKQRLDDDYNELSSHLAQRPTQEEVFLKSKGININDLDESTRKTFLEAQGIDVNYVLGERNVRPINTTFMVQGKNLFNKNDVETGKILTSNGAVTSNANYSTSGFIEVEPSANYAFTNIRGTAFYDGNKDLVQYYTAVNATTLSPENARFVRVSVETAKLNAAQMELGEVRTSYEPHKFYIPKDYTEKHDFDIEGVPDESILPIKTTFIKQGKNLFNADNCTEGYYINPSNGNLIASGSYTTTEMIIIKPNSNYVANRGIRFLVFYRNNGSVINGLENISTGTPINTPEDARYVRFSINNSYVDGLQFESGDKITPYEKWGYEFPQLLSNGGTDIKADEVLVFLPNEICVAVGRTIELYNKQVVWCGNINNYHIQWVSSIGKSFRRKWSFTADTASIGTYNLTINVYDNNMKQVATASTTVRVADSTMDSPVNLLNIGDSLTNGKAWLGELVTLSNNMINLIGTRGGSHKHEGRSGFSAGNYLEAKEYTFEGEGIHPFWDGTRFNWNYYKTNTSLSPNAVQLFLGTNGISLDPTNNANNIRQIVDFIRQDDATLPIFLVFTLYRGNQDGMGNQASNDGYSSFRSQWKLEEDRKVFNLMIRLHELMKEYTNLHFVPVSLTHDSEYNFGSVETPVNPRSTITEYLPSESVHPQREGYMQMADIMFSTMAAHL